MDSKGPKQPGAYNQVPVDARHHGNNNPAYGRPPQPPAPPVVYQNDSNLYGNEKVDRPPDQGNGFRTVTLTSENTARGHMSGGQMQHRSRASTQDTARLSTQDTFSWYDKSAQFEEPWYSPFAGGITMFLYTCLCAPCAQSDIAKNIDNTSNWFYSCWCCGVTPCAIRQRYRTQHGINATSCDDCCIISLCFLTGCAMSQIIHTENTRRKKEAEARRAGKKKKRKKRIRGFRYRNVSKQDLIQLREDTGNAITGCCGEDDFELPECFDCCASEGESETESTDEEEQGDGQRKGGKDARSEGGKSNHSRRWTLPW